MKNNYRINGSEVEIDLVSKTYGNKILLVDLDTFEKMQVVIGNKTVSMKKGTGKEKFYASFTTTEGKHWFVHRFAMNQYEGDLLVDHISGDGLDDRKSNLRLATYSENARNIESNSNSESGIKGLVYDDERKKWRVRVKLDGKVKYEHFFKSKEKAIEVLNRKLEKYHGEFVRQKD